jgi:hypothetical protein
MIILIDDEVKSTLDEFLKVCRETEGVEPLNDKQVQVLQSLNDGQAVILKFGAEGTTKIQRIA